MGREQGQQEGGVAPAGQAAGRLPYLCLKLAQHALHRAYQGLKGAAVQRVGGVVGERSEGSLLNL
jgi:hypothetical protein